MLASIPPCISSRAAGAGWVLVTSFQFVSSPSLCLYISCLLCSFFYILKWLCPLSFLQLSAIDVSARTTMKGAANCDKHCELQNSVNQQILERKLHFRDIPESMPASVSNHLIPATRIASSCLVVSCCSGVSLCVRGCSLLLKCLALDTSKALEVLPAAHSESSNILAFLLCCSGSLDSPLATLQAIGVFKLPLCFSEDMKSGQQTR